MDDGDAPATTCVRVGIHVAGGAVSGPPRVADAHRPLGQVLSHVGLEVGHFAPLLFNAQNIVRLQRRDAGAVVAAVLQPFQSIHKDGVSLLGSEVSDNSTHGARA